MSEFAPPGSNARMTKSQIKRYIKKMQEAQQLAKQKLKQAEESGELEKEKKDLDNLEEQLEQL